MITLNGREYVVRMHNVWNPFKSTIAGAYSIPEQVSHSLGSSTLLSSTLSAVLLLSTLTPGCGTLGSGSESPATVVESGSFRRPSFVRAGHVQSDDNDRRTSGSARVLTYLGESNAALEARVSGGLQNVEGKNSSAETIDFDAKSAFLIDVTERTDTSSPLVLDPGFALLIGPQFGGSYSEKKSGDPFAVQSSSLYGGLRAVGLIQGTSISLDAVYGSSTANLIQHLEGEKNGFSGTLSLGQRLTRGDGHSLTFFARGQAGYFEGDITGRLNNGRPVHVDQHSVRLGVDGALILSAGPVYLGPKAGIVQTETANHGPRVRASTDRVVESHGAGILGVDIGRTFGTSGRLYLESEMGVRYQRGTKDMDFYSGGGLIITFGRE